MFYVLPRTSSTQPAVLTSDLTIRNQSTFDHDGIPPGHNHGQNGCNVYGRAMCASILLMDASVRGNPAALS